MKKNDFMSELRQLPEGALKQRCVALAEELLRLRFKKVSGQLEQGNKITEARRNIARAQTLLSQKRLEAMATKGA